MKKFKIALVIIGVSAIILGIICFCQTTGKSATEESYKGINYAYTGIQNAVVITGNNVMQTNKILAFGFGSVLVVSGFTLCCTGIFMGATAVQQENNSDSTPDSDTTP